MSDWAHSGEGLIGRVRETAEVRRLLGESSSGRTYVLAIGGEAGIGKTSLASHAAASAAAEGFEVIWCPFQERHSARPYELWIAMITTALDRWWSHGPRRDAASLDEKELAEVFGSHWRTVVSVLPGMESAGTGPRTRRPASGSFARRQQDLFDGFVAFLGYLGRQRKVTVVVDNLHLVDEESLNALEIAISEIESSSILLILTYRTTTTTAIDGALGDMLGAVGHNENVVRIRLDRLTRPDVRRMVDRSGTNADEKSLDLIFDRSEGNPLLVEEFIELSRLNAGELDDRALDESALSLRARATIAARATTLSRLHRESLMMAAAVGRQFTVPQITELMGSVSNRDVNAGMEAARRLGIVAETEGGGPGYRFPHALIREAVLDLTPSSERARIQAVVGRKLEEYYGPRALNHAHELYPHFLAAGEPKEVQKGIRYALAAGNRALEQFAWKRARSVFGMLLSSLEKDLTPADRAAAQVGMGSAYSASVDRVQAAGCFRLAFDYYLTVKDYDRLVEIALQPIDIDLGDSYQFPLIERAVRVVPDDHPMRGELLRAYANGLYEARGRYGEAQELVRDSLEQARARGDRLSETHILLDKIYLDIRSSRFEEAIAGATEVLARSAIEPDHFAQSHANFLLMQAHLLKGDLENGKRYAYRSRDTVVPLGDDSLTCTGIAHVLRFELRAGNWKDIEAETERGLAIHPHDLFLLPIRAMMEFYLGRFQRGDEYLDRLFRMSEVYPEPRTLIFASIAQLCSHRWEIAGTTKYVKRARSLVERMSSLDLVPGVEVRVRIAEAILACQANDEVDAQAAYERLSAMPTYNLIRKHRIERVLGRVRHLCGDYERSAGHFLEAVASCEKYQDLPVLAATYAGYGDLLSDPNSFGSHADAQDAYGRGLSLARRLEMTPLAQRIESGIERLGNRAPHEAGSTLGRPLTARELEVLGLVAEGKTDAEIATVLGLSTYTVSNHVRHILQKTGAFNRIEAVRSHRAP